MDPNHRARIMKIIAAALFFALAFPALSDSLDEARVHELRQKYGIDIDRVLNPQRASQARMNALLMLGLAAQPRQPQRSLTERVADPFGWGHDRKHTHKPASGIYIDGGSYVIGPNFWCTKAGNVLTCN